MKRILSTLCAMLILTGGIRADEPALISIEAFNGILTKTLPLRDTHLIEIDRFLEMSRDPDTIILDTRSKDAYEKKHLKGAVHLNFSDFTEEKLTKVIPEKTTRILIYCNNNVRGDRANFADKGLGLALNIPTFINLVGYGYQNVYELANYLDADDPKWKFEGTSVNAKLKARVLPRLK